MSAGKFEIGRYEANSGFIWPVRVQPETKQLTIAATANSYPAGAATSGLPRLSVSRGKREYGGKVRKVSVRLTTDGTGATSEYKAGTVHNIPVFQETVFTGYTIGATGTYLGIACEVVGKTTEDFT